MTDGRVKGRPNRRASIAIQDVEGAAFKGRGFGPARDCKVLYGEPLKAGPDGGVPVVTASTSIALRKTHIGPVNGYVGLLNDRGSCLFGF